ncbi:response regulator [Paenibacillus sp. GCM10027626]|uniref:response regulator n=1 Tax=Paenibacillus sp. GCM10027626 TaxID=3273411 RepID=UPI00363FC7D5
MLQLLIVDDEIHAVRGIRAGVQWERLGFADVHEAYNIRQAKSILSSTQIDVMICDIEMPEGDGFQLLAWVKEHSPQTESLFLTCHADFEYAQKAIQLGSLDYMLKPVRFPDLEKAVSKAIGKVEKEKEKLRFVDTYKHYYQLWESSQPMFMERFWQDLINRSIPSRKERIKEVLQSQKIVYDDAVLFLPVLISVQRWHKELTLREEKIMEYALRNSFEELFALKQSRGQIIQVKSGALLAILTVDEGAMGLNSRLADDLKAYIATCSRYFFCDQCCYAGSPVPIEQVLDMVEALIEMDFHNVTRTNEVFFVGDKPQNGEAIPLPTMNGWTEMLKQGCKNDLIADIRRYLEEIKRTECIDVRLLHGLYEDFLQMIYHVMHYKGLRAHQVFSEMLLSRQAASATRSVADLGQWVTKLIEEVIGHFHAAGESQSLVDKAKSYIMHHIKDDLSRDDIARHVSLNADYLARIFKKETGLTISEYVLQERIVMAKEMLAKTDLPITGIAYELGYSNYSHFSKMFKKATLVNPQEYRKLNHA